jgi:homoserine kinase
MPAARPSGVRVSMPATSAYLGPGFDALGLAVDLRDELLVRVAGEGVRPGEWSIASYAGVSTGEDNLVLRAMRATFAALGWTPAELAARFVPRVPMSRGLGSSACHMRGCHGRAGAGWRRVRAGGSGCGGRGVAGGRHPSIPVRLRAYGARSGS